MSDIPTGSATNLQKSTQSASVQSEQEQTAKRSASERPTEENQKRFAQKLKGGDGQQEAQKPSAEAKEASIAQDKLSEEQTKNALQKLKGETSEQKMGQPIERKKEETSEQKANAILQGLHGAPATQDSTQLQAANLRGVESTNAPTQGTERLLAEFKSVADRVMRTETNLQQGGSIRLQLNNSILPGTSVTFAMVGGALHATFAGANKESLDKIRSHKERLTEHVREHSGVALIVEAKEEGQEQQGTR